MGRRSGEPGAEPELRAHLLAEAIEFRRTYVEVAMDDPVFRDYCWTETSKPVDQLASGGEYRFHGYLLPDDHAMRAAGGVHRDFVLGADNVLRQAE